MAEQSHKTEMAAALRGDFERLRRRRGDAVALDVTTPEEPIAAPPAEVETERPEISLLDRLLRR